MSKSHVVSTLTLIIFTTISSTIQNVNADPSLRPPATAPEAGTTASDCITLIYSMSDCLTYVEKNSNVSMPEKPCCSELAGMLDSKPVCLCQLLAKSKDFIAELNVSKALELPTVCGLKTPALSLCSGILIGGPAGAPSTEGPSSSAGGMSSDADETSPGKNGASNAHFSTVYLVSVLVLPLTLLIL